MVNYLKNFKDADVWYTLWFPEILQLHANEAILRCKIIIVMQGVKYLLNFHFGKRSHLNLQSRYKTS